MTGITLKDGKAVLAPLGQTPKRLLRDGGCVVCLILVFGAVQITVGLINIGLGPGRNYGPNFLTYYGVPYWLGAVFILAGIFSIVASCCSNEALVVFSIILNVLASIFSIMAIVLYTLDLTESNFHSYCDPSDPGYSCYLVAGIATDLLAGMDISLIVLVSVQLCFSISLIVLKCCFCFHAKQKNYQLMSKEAPLTIPAV